MDDYECIKKLGEGGFSEVYKVKEKKTNKCFALKKLKYMNCRVTAAGDEITAYKSIFYHDNVVRCYKVIIEPPNIAFVLEYCAMGNLSNFFTRFNPVKKRRKRFILQIASGLAHLHENNLAHRDLKPANIFITGKPMKPVAKIGDFGLAKLASDGFYGNLYEFYMSALEGTISFIGPEVYDGHYTAKTDIFALGLIFATIICFNKSRHDSLSATLAEAMGQHGQVNVVPAEAVRNGDVIDVLKKPRMAISVNLRNLIESMLEKDPHNRPTAEEVADFVQADIHPGGTSRNCFQRVFTRIFEAAAMGPDGPLSGNVTSF